LRKGDELARLRIPQDPDVADDPEVTTAVPPRV
jgi:hypothetical protein